MDVTLTAEQELVRQTALALARNAASERASGNDEGMRTWKQMADAGWIAGLVRPNREIGLLEAGLMVEACAEGGLVSPLFAVAIEAGRLVADSRTDDFGDAWLAEVEAGRKLIAAAVFEQGAAFPSTSFQAVVETRSGSTWLRGTKLFVRYAEASVGFQVAAMGSDGPVLVFVPNDKGVTLRRMPTSGGDPVCEVKFDVEVPLEAVVPPQVAVPALDRLFERGAAILAAELVGIGQAALDLTLAYAQSRVQFGRPIGSFQAVQHHCANMARELTATRLLVYQALLRIDTTRPAGREVAMAKAKASAAVPEILRLAHQIHGGVGYYADYPLGDLSRRALAARAAYGNALDHRMSLAAHLKSETYRVRPGSRHGIQFR